MVTIQYTKIEWSQWKTIYLDNKHEFYTESSQENYAWASYSNPHVAQFILS